MNTEFLQAGLLSVTFRGLSVEKILAEASLAGLSGIEWGGDVHVPAGDLQVAKSVGRLTREAGLSVSAYGSYYAFEDCLGNASHSGPDWKAVLDTAEALDTRMIRIWPGKIGSAEASEDWFNAVVEHTQTIAESAKTRDLSLGFEFHNNSLTDTADSTLRLLNAINRDNVSTFWQTNRGGEMDTELHSIHLLKDRISQLHCHHLLADQSPPYALLKEGSAQWIAYLEALHAPHKSHWISIEFVKDGSLESFREDAATLLQWCKHFSEGPQT